jgi:hypothetical protein
LRDQLIAEIKLKRSEKADEQQILALIAKGKDLNDYSELAETIQALKKYRSRSPAYQKYEAEIDQLEVKLNKLDPEKYQEEIRNDLNQQIENEGLTADEVEAQTQQVIEDAVSDPTPQKKKAAEEAISQNKANVELKKLLAQARALKTKTEKQEMITKISTYSNKNSYCRNSYQELKAEVDKVLAQLQDEKTGDDSTPDPSSPLKIILPLVLIGVVALAIVGIVW